MEKLLNQPKSLIGQSLKNLEFLAESLGSKKFRGRQLFDWIYSKQLDDYGKMSNLSLDLKEKLKITTDFASKSARLKIEKAGGSINISKQKTI